MRVLLFSRLLSALTLLLVAVYPVRVQAQVGVEWAVATGTGYYEMASDMAVAPEGTLYVAGGFGGGSPPNVVLLKFDPSGNQIGSQSGRGENLRGVAVDSKGNYVVTGEVRQPDWLGLGERNHLYLAKYSADGNLLWERTGGLPTYVPGKYNEGRKVAIDGNDNIYILGTSCGEAVFGNVTFPAGPGGPILFKYTPDGALLWAKRVENTGSFQNPSAIGNGGWATGIAINNAGDVVTTGYIYKGTATFGEVVVTAEREEKYIAKYTSEGVVKWVRLGIGYGGVALDDEGSIYFVGSLWGGGGMECGKLTPRGETAWRRVIPGTVYGGYGSSVTLDSRGEPIFAAEFEGVVSLDGMVLVNGKIEGKYSYLNTMIFKSNANGKFQWALAGGHGMWSRPTGLVADRQRNVYVFGDLTCGSRGFDNGGAVDCGPGMFGDVPLSPVDGDMDIYLAKLSLPASVQLNIERTTTGVRISWLAAAAGYVLEVASAPGGATWAPVPTAPVVERDHNVVTLALGDVSQYFRLKQN